MNRLSSHQHSSELQSCWTHHNSLEQKIQSLTFAWQRIRIPLQPPDVHDRSSRDRVSCKIVARSLDRMYNWLLFSFIPILEYPCQDRSIASRREDLILCLKIPESGTSVGFYIFLICSIDWRSGESPPCIQSILSSISAATGRQLKQSMKVFHSLMLYRLLPKIISFVTFVIKAINSVDWGAFVISSKQEKVSWILDFVG